MIEELKLEINKDEEDLENATIDSFALTYLDRQNKSNPKSSFSPDHNPLKPAQEKSTIANTFGWSSTYVPYFDPLNPPEASF